MSSEGELAGANYILTFYTNVEQLTAAYAEYINKIVPIKAKVSKEDLAQGKIDSLDDEDLTNLNSSLNTLRYYITNVYIKSQALKSKVKTFENKELTDFYKKIKDKPLIDNSEIEDFILKINSCLIDDIVQQLLVKSRDIYNKITQNE